MNGDRENPYRPELTTFGEPGWLLQLRREISYAQVMGAISVATGVGCSIIGFAFASLAYKAAQAVAVSLARRGARDSELRRRVSLAETLAIVGVAVSTINLVVIALITIYVRSR
jgi:hypothetical protein